MEECSGLTNLRRNGEGWEEINQMHKPWTQTILWKRPEYGVGVGRRGSMRVEGRGHL